MVHILSAHLRSEFLAVPTLVRLDMASGEGGFEPTLLLKAGSLSLKYFLRRKEFRIVVTRIGSKIAYAVEIPDDPVSPGMVWSLVERQVEVEALRRLTLNPRCVMFLFNEIAVSVAWTEVKFSIDAIFSNALKSVQLHTETEKQDEDLVGTRFGEIWAGANITDTQILKFQDVQWNELEASYITMQASVSKLSLFNTDEGGQQEEIAVWLTDSLHPRGCVKSPKVHEKVVRELSDILLSYENGVFLIESKALGVLVRDSLPSREKLSRDIIKHVLKAFDQLVGGIKNLRKGLLVTNGTGAHLDIEREKPPHAIILVPDLSLLENASDLGAKFIRNFMEITGGYLHILDTAELLRVVQAAGMIAEGSKSLSKMMAFDWYLMERAKRAIDNPTPCFFVLFRKGPANNAASS